MKRLKTFAGFAFVFSAVVFAGIGYASLSDSFLIDGNVSVKPKPYVGIYISDVEVVSGSNLINNSTEYIRPTNLNNDLIVNSYDSYITYAITVHNNSDVTYWYIGLDFVDELGSNELIGSSNGITITTRDHQESNSDYFNNEDWVPAQTRRTFYATYRFGSEATGNILTYINFKFGLHMDSVQDEFLRVLNDKVSENGYYYLESEFDKKYKESGSTTIANIGSEKTIFDKLFGENLTVNVDGEEKPVTIMVSRRDVDGNTSTGDSYDGNTAPSGCEYTVYITVGDLSNPGESVTVYAVSYTCRSDGTFYQIGELYEGTCTVQDYITSNETYEGSFDLMNWDATAKEYNVTDKITYKVGYEQGTTYDKFDTIEELMGENDNEFYNKINNNSQDLLKPVCNIIYSYRHNNGQWIEFDNEANKNNPGFDDLKRAFDRIKPYCYIGNGAQEVKIQNANSLSRAELIPMLENIQQAYDYYLEVN